MNQVGNVNSIDFIMQAGPVAIFVAALLLMMSVASWYFIVVKCWQYWRLSQATKHYQQAFWEAPNVAAALLIDAKKTPAYHMAHDAVEAATHHQTHATKNIAEACSHEEFVARSMRRSMAKTASQLESGLSVLASVGSVSPFIGLFGTVWGIYHALAAISASGQATLDKVAGPVGEALIMTAIGLAVAIPAVLAYNAFVKTNRGIIQQLDNFGQDLHILLTTGALLNRKINHVQKSFEHGSANSAMNVRGNPA